MSESVQSPEPITGWRRWRNELPLIGWLVAVWGALWGDWGLPNLAFGLILAVGVTRLLVLPPVHLSGRFNVFAFAMFVVTFVWQVALASVQVFWQALAEGQKVDTAIVGVQLRTNNDLIMTAVGHTMALIPGSMAIEVDRGTGTLYFHVLGISNAEQAQDFRRSVLKADAAWLRIMGSREELELLSHDSHHSTATSATGAISGPAITQSHSDSRGKEPRS